MWLSFWITMGSLVDAEITLPTSKQNGIFPMNIFELQTIFIHFIWIHTLWAPPQCDLREECVVLRVRLDGISCGALILSLGSSGGPSQTAQPGLGRWQWHTEAVDFWHTTVTNGEEKVREICSEAILKDMEIQPISKGYNLAQMKSLNHEYCSYQYLWFKDGRWAAIYFSRSCFYGSNTGGQWQGAHVLSMFSSSVNSI